MKGFSNPPSLFPRHNFLQTFPMKTWKTSADIVHVGHEADQHSAALFFSLLSIAIGISGRTTTKQKPDFSSVNHI